MTAVQLPNPVLAKLRRGEVSIGSWLNLASPLAAETMAVAGYEWLAIDAEHSPWDLGLITDGLRAIESRDCVPIVRPWTHDPAILARLLDAGAMGLVVPHVSTPEQAESIARAVRYPPRGARSSGAGRTFLTPMYRQEINDNLLICPQIEDLEGVDNAAAIMAVEGMDVAFLGPGDLAASMGLAPSEVLVHADHLDAVRRVRRAAEANGKPSGIPVGTAQSARWAIEQGFTFIDLSCDIVMLRQTAIEMLKATRA